MAFNANLNFRTANNAKYREILQEYERKELLPDNFPDHLSSRTFRVMTLQRSRLRKYLGLDENNFNAVTYEEISSTDRYRLDSSGSLALPSLPELAMITDNVVLEHDGETVAKVIQRMSTHVAMMLQRSLCPICQTLVENFTLQILTPCGHGCCSACWSRIRASQRLNGGRRVNLNGFSERSLGNGWAAIDYEEVVYANCPICREEVRRNYQCFF